MSGIEQGLVELAAAANEWWSVDVITAAAWHHSMRPGCLGYTVTTNGRAFCSYCGWQVVPRSGQLALLALGRIGQTFAIAHEVAKAYVESYLTELGHRVSDVQLDGAGGFTYCLDIELKQITFTHRIDL